MRMSSAWIAALMAVLSSSPSWAQPPCAFVDFNADTPGAPPAIGGPNQPSMLFIGPGTSILVQASANGIGSQPVVLSVSGQGQFVSVAKSFPPVSLGVVRVEATLAIGHLGNGFFLQTGVDEEHAVVTRIMLLASGSIIDYFGTPLGTYAPGVPFRARMDIDMTADTWSCAIDNELDGFADDAPTSGIPFVNPTSVIPSVGAVNCSLLLFGEGPTATTAAYDDISVVCPGVTAARPGTWGDLKLRYH
jgi:hypothetical protein